MPRFRFRIRLRYAALLLVSAVACDLVNPVDTCACSMPPPFDVVYGTVTEPGGTPADGATVRADVGAPGCQSAVEGVTQPTDAAGRYRVLVHRTGDYAEQCIRLVALAPAGSGLRSSDTTRLTLPTPVSHPPDSVRVNLVLRAP